MTQLEANLTALKEGTVEMITLAKNQLKKSKQAFLEKDQDLADEIFISEKNLGTHAPMAQTCGPNDLSCRAGCPARTPSSSSHGRSRS